MPRAVHPVVIRQMPRREDGVPVVWEEGPSDLVA